MQQHPETCTTRGAQHTEDLFSLSGFTNPNNHNHAKQSRKCVYQLDKSTLVFFLAISLRLQKSFKHGQVCM